MRTNKVPTGPYRGAGRPEAAYFLECTVDAAARELGIDPLELRRRNLIRDFPYETALGWTYDSGDYGRCLELAEELVQPERHADDTRVVGTGFGMYVERAGGMFETAVAELLPDGRVLIRSGSSPHGQGHDTTFAQLAAERLGVGARGRGAALRRLEGGSARCRHLRQPLGGHGRVGRRPGRRRPEGEAAGREGPPAGDQRERPLRVRPGLLVGRLRRRRRDRAVHGPPARAAGGGGGRRRDDRQPAAGRGTGDRRDRAGARRSALWRRPCTTRRAIRPSPRSWATAC